MLEKTATQDKSTCEGNSVPEICLLLSAHEALEASLHWQWNHTHSREFKITTTATAERR